MKSLVYTSKYPIVGKIYSKSTWKINLNYKSNFDFLIIYNELNVSTTCYVFVHSIQMTLWLFIENYRNAKLNAFWCLADMR